MVRALVVGKFYPPHAGHHYLIDTALAEANKVTVWVVAQTGQTIPGELRATWLRQMHPKAKVEVIPDLHEDNDSVAWAKYTIGLLGYVPDVVYTSEAYGHTWAKALGCRHRQVDQSRATVPISATQVRANPLASWDYLSPGVRAHYAIRICVLGAESTGATTMTRVLAEHYQTNWVPEYGRAYTQARIDRGEKLPLTWSVADFMLIALEQARQEDTAAANCNKLLICDTDAFATSVWTWRYLGEYKPGPDSVAERYRPALYLVTAPDIPFEQDGIRDSEHIRQSMHKEFLRKLKATNRPYVILRGSPQRRLRTATNAIDALLAQEAK